MKNYLVVCQLVENLLIKIDMFMANNQLELKSWLKTYNINDQFSFSDSIKFYLSRNLFGKIYDFYVHG